MMTSPIAYHRERAQMSQQELGLQCGLTQKYVDELERRLEPRLTVRLKTMSLVLQVPVDELRP
jgi:transcriptional regulator with XRE-family HTH domain